MRNYAKGVARPLGPAARERSEQEREARPKRPLSEANKSGMRAHACRIT